MIAKATVSNDETGYRKTWLLIWPGIRVRCPERWAAWLVKIVP